MIKYHTNIIQGEDAWFAARCGLLTASEMKLILTPSKLQYASNDKERAHVYELAAQRITQHVEPHYISDDMLRGRDDELDAKRYYCDNYAEVTDVGFITNDKWGFTIGYSPDGLVGDDLQIEVKGRRQRFQIETIVKGEVPDEFMIQIQTGLMVSERAGCEFISFCGGMPMKTIRVESDKRMQDAIEAAAKIFHTKLDSVLKGYAEILDSPTNRLIPTERRIESEMFI